MISRTGDYALKAVVYLARHIHDGPVPSRQIAADLNMPRKYLSSILCDLARCGVLGARPGRTGGFQLLRPPDRIRLHDVLAPFEQVCIRRPQHPIANAVCNDRDPCGSHARWRHLREEYGRFFVETTVSDIARPGRQVRMEPQRARKK